MERFITLSMANQATITCPIFDTQTPVRACVRLREKVYRGENVEVRKGCQAVMEACKCPVAEAVRRIAFNRTDIGDDLGDLEPRQAKIQADILEAIHPVMVMENTLVKHRVSDEERTLIASANSRIEKQITTAPRMAKYKPQPIRASTKSSIMATPAATPTETAIQKAAASGDMSAAIS